MSVLPRDILLRIGGRTLLRHGVLVHGGSTRTNELKETFSRADASTCATVVDRDGVIRTVAANIPRIEWTDLDGNGVRETPALLLEQSRTNSCLRSEELDNAAWTADGTTVTANVATAPDGTATMDKLVETAAAGNHQRWQGFTITDSEYVAISAYVKSAERTKLRFIFVDGATGNFFGTQPDLVAETVGGIGSGTATHLASRIVKFPNGVYRVESVGRLAAGVTAARVYCGLRDAAGSASYTGDGTSGAYYWGVQVERLGTTGPHAAGSYIKTVGSTVTRASDSFIAPVNWGTSTDVTIGARIVRPMYLDIAATLNSAPHIYLIGGSNGNIRGAFGAANPHNCEATVDTAGTDQFPGAAVPAGSPLTYCGQFKNLTTVPASRLDMGAGFPSYTTVASALPAFNGQTVAIGSTGTGSLTGLLIDWMAMRGQFSLAEYLEVP